MLLAAKQAPKIKFGRYIISATSPFNHSDAVQLRLNAPCVTHKYFPRAEALYDDRNWKMNETIDRVYINTKAREELGWQPKYDARIYSPQEMTSYEAWSMEFFHNKDYISDPLLDITIQIDITKGVENYKKIKSRLGKTSFNAYLIWCLVNAGKHLPQFQYRKISNIWYSFEHLPVYVPIAVGGDSRFLNLVLESASLHTLEMFFEHYDTTIDKLKRERQ